MRRCLGLPLSGEDTLPVPYYSGDSLSCLKVRKIPYHFPCENSALSQRIKSFKMLLQVLDLKLFCEHKLWAHMKPRNRVRPIFSYDEGSLEFVDPIIHVLDD